MMWANHWGHFSIDIASSNQHKRKYSEIAFVYTYIVNFKYPIVFSFHTKHDIGIAVPCDKFEDD